MAAGAVTVTSTGNITTAGTNASGIFASSRRWRGDGDLDRQYHHRGHRRTGIAAFGTSGAVDGDLDRQHHHRGRQRGRDSCPAALAR